VNSQEVFMAINYEKFKEIKLEKLDGVLTVTLNRPENGNPTAWTLIAELNEIWKSLPEENEVRAVLFNGAGEDFSCMRGNVAIHPPLKQPHPLQNLELAGSAIHGGGAYHMSTVKNLLDVPQPIVAAVQGRCTGLATTLVLFCDIIFAAEDAQISDPHINRGMVPGDGGAVIWPLLVGPTRAKQYLLTGDSLSGTEAERIGLINKAVPAGELQAAALAFAKRLASGPPLAIRFTKHAINQVFVHQMALNWELSDALQVFSTQTEDTREIRRAIAENRPPKLTGR
jgi:enoyl-CoA hydratase